VSALPLSLWGADPRLKPVHKPPFAAVDYAATYERQDVAVVGPGFVSGSLTVREQGPYARNSEATWYCDCECGKKRVLKPAKSLRDNKVGFCSWTCPARCKLKIGARYGHLVVVQLAPGRAKKTSGRTEPNWECQCDCGAVVVKSASLLRQTATCSRQCPKGTLRLVTWRGQTKSAAQWSGIVDVPAEMIRNRLNLGWTPERALTTPPRVHRAHRRKPREA
jgi:hypothetical protein